MAYDSSRIAVIDIGSNSVRIVVYDGLKRSLLPLFNEKCLCGMARDMEKTGQLNPEGVKNAYDTLERFTGLMKHMNVQKILCVATSAVRDASDGDEFVSECKKRFDLDVQILSGKKEAYFTSMGVLGSLHGVDGIIGDLGGGSLELTNTRSLSDNIPKDAMIDDRKSYPLGPLRLKNISGNSRSHARDIISKQLHEYGLRKKLEGRIFYAVGGGFRALAKAHIYRTNYPLAILHNYTVIPKDFLPTVKLLSTTTPSKLKAMPSISNNRADTMALTALIMEQIIHIGKPEKIIFSVQGLREGVLYDIMPECEGRRDSLIAAAEETISHVSPEGSISEWVKFGNEMYSWISPLFENKIGTIKRLQHAAAMLSRLAWHEHTTYRADIAYRWVLDSTLPSVTHAERAFIALCLYYRYKSDIDPCEMKRMGALLSPDMVCLARNTGYFMRLGFSISGGATGILENIPINIKKKTFYLAAEENFKSFVSQSVINRMKKIAALTGYDYLV